jgi:hypothetical protein
MSSRFWQVIDTAAHKLSLPKPLRRRICDRFDLSLGVTRDELHRTASDAAEFAEFDTTEAQIDAMVAEGKCISDEIDADPVEAERLRQARQEARSGNVTGRYDDA